MVSTGSGAKVMASNPQTMHGNMMKKMAAGSNYGSLAAQPISKQEQDAQKYFNGIAEKQSDPTSDTIFVGLIGPESVVSWVIGVWIYVTDQKSVNFMTMRTTARNENDFIHENNIMLAFNTREELNEFKSWYDPYIARFDLAPTDMVPTIKVGGKIDGWYSNLQVNNKSSMEERSRSFGVMDRFKIWCWLVVHTSGKLHFTEPGSSIFFSNEADYILYTMTDPLNSFESVEDFRL